ncbi:MAG: DNA starvation/stationary phase protection protein Dps [Alphaproteobacteria bacterium]|nr:DNA starvation/stationary phase protection protein Dps [Alphaproteobacteria bacterium]
MHRTRNDLPAQAKGKSIGLLNARLADALALKLATKQAHWNVKGPGFIGLHELFDQLAAGLDAPADEMAERIVALGGTALGTATVVARDASLAPYPLEIYSGREHVEALAMAFAALANSVRKNIDDTMAVGDAATADLFTGLSAALDKSLWFLEAHLQADH